MIVALTGNPFLAEEALPQLLRERGQDVRGWPRLSGEEVSEVTLRPLLSPGLFGDTGVIVDLAGVKPEKALLELLANAPVTAVILDEAPPAARLKVYQKAGEVLTQAAPTKSPEIAAWTLARARARAQKLTLEREAAAYLAEVFGPDLASIASELNKLALLEGPHTRAEVQRVVGLEPPGDSFALLAAATTGKAAQATEQLRRLLSQGEDPFKLLGTVVWQYSLIARCVGLLQEGRISDAQAAARLKSSPYPTKKALEVARKLNETKIGRHLQHIQAADLAMKRGLAPGVVLERLIVQLSV